MNHIWHTRKMLYGLLILLTANLHAQNVQPITLNQALNTALEKNFTLKASEQQILRAKGSLKQRLFPDQTVVGIDYEDSPGDFGERVYYVQQDFEFPLTYYYGYRAFSKQVETAEAAYKRDALNLKIDVRLAYLQWLQAYAKWQNAQQNVKIADDFETQTQRLFATGEVGRIVSSRSKINLAQAKLNVDIAANDEMAARNKLLSLMGIQGNTQLQPQDSLSGIIQTESVKIPAVFDSTKQLFLKYAELNVDQSKRMVNFQRSGYLPDISLKYFQMANDEKTQGFGVGIGIPIFFWRQQGAVQMAKAQYYTNRFLLEQTKLEVNNNWQVQQQILQQYQSQLNNYQQLADDAALIVDDSRRAYEAGEISYLQYLDAQQSYITSRNLLADVQFKYLSALTQLYSLSGDL